MALGPQGRRHQDSEVEAPAHLGHPGNLGGPECATRRTAISPVQRAKTGGGVFGSDG
jgi:hypothetical protein